MYLLLPLSVLLHLSTYPQVKPSVTSYIIPCVSEVLPPPPLIELLDEYKSITELRGMFKWPMEVIFDSSENAQLSRKMGLGGN